MTPNRENLEAWLELSLSDGLDALTPEQIAALEAALNELPELAARASSVIPAGDRPAAAIPSPTESEWNGVWSRIESGLAAPQLRVVAPPQSEPRGGEHAASARRVSRPRIFRLWTSVSAAAACIALVLVWRGLLATPPAHSAPQLWTMTASANVEILELEVYDDAVAAVDFGDSDNGAVVISVYERRRASEGA